jgi:hypothetical protein
MGGLWLSRPHSGATISGGSEIALAVCKTLAKSQPSAGSQRWPSISQLSCTRVYIYLS